MTYEESYDWYCNWSVIQQPVTEAVIRAAGAAHDSGRGAAGQPVTVLVPGNGNCDSPVKVLLMHLAAGCDALCCAVAGGRRALSSGV